MSGHSSKNIEQLIYTSCRRGLGDGDGFQTQAASPGLGSRERYELEHLPTYKYPSRLRQDGGPSEIERYCPPSLLFKRLPCGSDAVTRYVYAGTDYTGRWGNFLSHSLLLPDKGSQEFLAIDFATWPHWQDTVCEEPPVLSAISLLSLRLNTHRFALEQLSAFIRSDSKRAEQFVKMLAALWQSRITNRPVFVRDQVDNLTTWVACLTKILPARLGNYFSFSTFVNAKLADVDIQCTTADSDIEINSEMLCEHAFTFDFVGKNFSEVEVDTDSFYAFAAQMLTTQPLWFDKLNDFCELLECDLQMETLPQVLLSFRLSNGEQVASPKQVELIPKTLQFVGASLKKRNESNLVLDTILTAAMMAQAEDQTAWNRSYMQSLVTLVCSERSSHFARIAWNTCLKLFYGDFTSATPDWRPLLAMLEKVGLSIGLSQLTVRQELIHACNCRTLLTQLDENNSACLAEFLVELITNPVHDQNSDMSPGRAHSKDQSQDRPELQLVKQIFRERDSNRLATQIIARIANVDDGSHMADLLSIIAEDAPLESIQRFGDHLAKILSSLSNKKAAVFRNQLAKADLFDLLGAELKFLSEQVSESNHALIDTLVSSQKNWMGKGKQFGIVIDDIWRSLPATKKHVLAMQFWNATDVLQQLPDHNLESLTSFMISLISLGDDETPNAAAIEKLYLLCEGRRLPIQIRLELRRKIDRISSGKLRTVRTFLREWQDLRFAEEPIDSKTGTEVVQLLLGTLLSYCQSAGETRLVIEWSQSTADRRAIERTLMQVLSPGSTTKWNLESVGSFVIAVLTDYPSDQLATLAVRNMETWLNELDNSIFNRLDAYIEKHKGELPKARQDVWLQIYLSSQARRGSGVGRTLRQFFKKLWGN